MGETPRLGLSVVGRLAQANGFQVSLRPSAYAGVRVVLIIPRDLVTTVPAPAASIPGAGVVPAPRPALSRPVQAPESRGEDFEINGNVLPQRHRRAPAAAAANGTANHSAARADGSTPPASGARPAPPPGLWLAAFHNAVSGETSSASPLPGDDPLSSKEGEQS
jgi:hypothetical protein